MADKVPTLEDHGQQQICQTCKTHFSCASAVVPPLFCATRHSTSSPAEASSHDSTCLSCQGKHVFYSAEDEAASAECDQTSFTDSRPRIPANLERGWLAFEQHSRILSDFIIKTMTRDAVLDPRRRVMLPFRNGQLCLGDDARDDNECIYNIIIAGQRAAAAQMGLDIALSPIKDNTEGDAGAFRTLRENLVSVGQGARLTMSFNDQVALLWMYGIPAEYRIDASVSLESHLKYKHYAAILYPAYRHKHCVSTFFDGLILALRVGLARGLAAQLKGVRNTTLDPHRLFKWLIVYAMREVMFALGVRKDECLKIEPGIIQAYANAFRPCVYLVVAHVVKNATETVLEKTLQRRNSA